MTEAFERALRSSGYIHGTLRADEQKTVEARLLCKDALDQRALWDGCSTDAWSLVGRGTLSLPEAGVLRISVASRADHWPSNGSHKPSAGDYSHFGYTRAVLRLDREDLRGFNQLRCRIRPDCKGHHRPMARLEWRNEGEHPIPDVYYREGFHDVNLENGRWNECVWEFPDLPRDAVTQIAVTVPCYGEETSAAGLFVFDVQGITLVQVARPDISLGWQGNEDNIAFSTSGYFASGAKTAVCAADAGQFALLHAVTDAVVYVGDVQIIANEKGRFGLIDFSAFCEAGRYRLRVGAKRTHSFPIGEHVMEEAAWKVIHFLYNERCGFPVSGGHSACHQDITADHNGLTMSYSGGWHDAGDVSQQTLQSAEVAHGLLELAGAVEAESLLQKRLIEEAVWGLDFVLRTRFGDGYRATSVGLCRWTNGLMGDMDDWKARVHNRSFENFLMAGVEAAASRRLGKEDPPRAFCLGKAAQEDWQFAIERFEAVGVEDGFSFFEHTYNADYSQYCAAACWSAAEIFALTGEETYEKQAARFAGEMLACMERGTEGVPMQGFFYRKKDHRAMVHFNHQSRDHLFMQALVSLLGAAKAHQDAPKWEAALHLHGKYLKALCAHAAPYGMMPAGLHAYSEVDDGETFPYMHLMTTHESERQNYKEQLESGIQVADGYAIRQFPVWFSFRGNAAVQLSAGKSAGLIGKYFGDAELMRIAHDQLYWISGKNPFAQSLIYGEGSNYAQQYAALAGEMVGELPVGVQTRGNEDVPYWPMANNATYKEVWTSTAGHWLWVLAELY